MTYATAAQVALRLGNPLIGVAGSTIISDTELAEVLEEIDADINVAIDQTTNIVLEPYASMLKKIEVDVAAMMILQIRHYREGNLVENASNFWQITPEFTFVHDKKLQIVRQRLQSQTFIGNTETGQVTRK